MDKDFVKACDREIAENKFKGDWTKYSPKGKKLIQEMTWHMNKLVVAIANGSPEMIKEYACDVGNYCEKAFALANELGGVKAILNPKKDPIKQAKPKETKSSFYDDY